MAQHTHRYGSSYDSPHDQVNQQASNSPQYSSTSVRSDSGDTFRNAQHQHREDPQRSSTASGTALALSSQSSPDNNQTRASNTASNSNLRGHAAWDGADAALHDTPASNWTQRDDLSLSAQLPHSDLRFSRIHSPIDQLQHHQLQRYTTPPWVLQPPSQQQQQQLQRSLPQPLYPQTAAQNSHTRSWQPSHSVDPLPSVEDPPEICGGPVRSQHKEQEEAEIMRKAEEQEIVRRAEEQRVVAEKSKAEEKKREAEDADDKKAEMRAMLRNMDAFSAKDPAMLAALWEEERDRCATSSQTPPLASTAPAPSPRVPASKAHSLKQQKEMVAPTSSATKIPTPLARLGRQQQSPFQRSPTLSNAPGNNTGPSQLRVSQANVSPTSPLTSLVEIIAQRLTSLPENAGKHITRDDVLKLVRSSPTYGQLCDALERRFSLHLDRSVLARLLSRPTPDTSESSTRPMQSKGPATTVNGTAVQVNSTSAQANGSIDKSMRNRPRTKDATENSCRTGDTPNPRLPSSTAPTYPTRELDHMRQPLLPGPYRMQGSNQPMYISPNFAQPRAANGTRPTLQSQPREIGPKFNAKDPSRPSRSQNESPRKRKLTGGVSGDRRPAKQVRVSEHIRGFTQPQPQTEIRKPTTEPDFHMLPSLPGLDRNRLPHPEIIPTKPRLEPFLSNSPPAPIRPKSQGLSSKQQQQKRIKDKKLVEPIVRDRAARKSRYDSRTIARDVLLATGRHPDMRALNAHLLDMAKLLGDHGGSYHGNGNSSDLSTIRWDIIDPSPLNVDAKARSNARAASGNIVDDVADADDEDDDAPSSSRRMLQQQIDQGDGTVRYVPVYEHIHWKEEPTRRYGRPPRHSMPEKNAAVPFSFTDANGVRQHVTLGRQGTPARQTAAQPRATPQSAPPEPAAGQAIGYSAFRQSGNAVKKKGRPVGWRKAIHSREAAGLPPAAPHGQPRKPEKSKEAVGPRQMVEPQYQVYKCHWKGCKAELHNLDTLKKHVVKIHGRPTHGGVFECLWQPCTAQSSHVDVDGGTTKVASWVDMDDWIHHIDEEHLQPVAWELGDGPRGGMSGYDATDSYLSDSQGRSLTPIITPDFDRAEATSQVAPARIPSSALGRPSGSMSKVQKKAAAELHELEDHKKRVGVVMEKTGSRFVTDKRRRGFLDDEDFEDEIESEGEGPPADDEEGEA